MKTTLMLKGFYLEGTGGGCTALRCDLGDRYILVTDDDCAAPTTESKNFIVGYYGPEDKQLGYEQVDSMDKVHSAVRKFVEESIRSRPTNKGEQMLDDDGRKR